MQTAMWKGEPAHGSCIRAPSIQEVGLASWLWHGNQYAPLNKKCRPLQQFLIKNLTEINDFTDPPAQLPYHPGLIFPTPPVHLRFEVGFTLGFKTKENSQIQHSYRSKVENRTNLLVKSWNRVILLVNFRVFMILDFTLTLTLESWGSCFKRPIWCSWLH